MPFRDKPEGKSIPTCRRGSKRVCKARCGPFDPFGGKILKIAQTDSKGWTQPMAKVHPPEVYAVIKKEASFGAEQARGWRFRKDAGCSEFLLRLPLGAVRASGPRPR